MKMVVLSVLAFGVGFFALYLEWLAASWLVDSVLHWRGGWNIVAKIVITLFLSNFIRIFAEEAYDAWWPKKK